MHRVLLLLLMACGAGPEPATPDPSGPPTDTQPCEAAREGAACTGDPAFCVESWGAPCGWSSALWCRDGRWVREEEQNDCPR